MAAVPVGFTHGGDSFETKAPRPHASDGLFVSHSKSESGLMGPSSNIAFLERASDASKPAASSLKYVDKDFEVQLPTEDAASWSNSMQETSIPWNMTAMVLPERQLADALLSRFWGQVHPIFPVTHQQSMTRLYEQLWTPNNMRLNWFNKAVMYATLNIMLALGCQYSNSFAPEHGLALGSQFYERSMNLVPLNKMDSASLGIVQLLLLTGIYLQSTSYANRCWNTVGLALRVAQGLGLHLDRSASPNESQQQKETRRRVWYICVMMDR